MKSTATFTLKSITLGGEATTAQAFNDWGSIGDNISPQLSWENIPEGTKSFAVTMFDPDAPTGSGWWHWVMFDISSDVNELVENAGTLASNLAPTNSIQSINNYGTTGYGGPCPPEGHGWHQYIITIHALKVESLGLDEDTNPAIVGYNLWENTISKASIVTYYKRDKK
jgi:Raf kinase inhibitor-like YbhB/YbcL family protein